jgi:hypothetical protein
VRDSFYSSKISKYLLDFYRLITLAIWILVYEHLNFVRLNF